MISGHATVDAALADAGSQASGLSTSGDDPPIAGKGAGSSNFPLGKAVEVLQLADPKNSVEGNWSRDGDKIVVQPGNQCRLAIPVAVHGSYDLELEFNRHDGEGDLHLTIPVGAHQCNVMVAQDKHVGGLDAVNGRRPFEDNNPTTVRSPEIENDRTHDLLVKVRLRKADAASIDVLLDGKPYLPHWEGDTSALSISQDWAMPTTDHLGLGAWRSQVAYSSLKLRMIAGRATIDTGVEPATSGSEELATISPAPSGTSAQPTPKNAATHHPKRPLRYAEEAARATTEGSACNSGR